MKHLKKYSVNSPNRMSVVCKLFKAYVEQPKTAEFISRVSGIKRMGYFKLDLKIHFRLSMLCNKYVSAFTQQTTVNNSAPEFSMKIKY